MALKDEIKGYIVSSGWSITKLNDKLNEINNTDLGVQNLSNKINRESLKYSDILQIADILGYEIEWKKQKDNSISNKIMNNSSEIKINYKDFRLLIENDKNLSLKECNFLKCLVKHNKNGMTDISNEILIKSIKSNNIDDIKKIRDELILKGYISYCKGIYIILKYA